MLYAAILPSTDARKSLSFSELPSNSLTSLTELSGGNEPTGIMTGGGDKRGDKRGETDDGVNADVGIDTEGEEERTGGSGVNGGCGIGGVSTKVSGLSIPVDEVGFRDLTPILRS